MKFVPSLQPSNYHQTIVYSILLLSLQLTYCFHNYYYSFHNSLKVKISLRICFHSSMNKLSNNATPTADQSDPRVCLKYIPAS